MPREEACAPALAGAPPAHRDATGEPADAVVDFTRSIPPMPPALPLRLSAGLLEMSGRPDLGSVARSALAGGSAEDRMAGAAWLAPRFRQELDTERILVTNGTQSALLILFEKLVGGDGLLLAETLSYGVLAAMAQRAHILLEGLPIDAAGLLPEAFEQVCRRRQPRALYCNPTIQNPTTAVMPEERRVAIAAIARRYGVALIEDDALGRLHPEAPPPIAALAPDLVWYVMGLTKCLSHGLRIAYLVGPSGDAVERVFGPSARLSHWFPSPLAATVVNTWICSGAAEEICAAIRQESDAREALARRILGPAIVSQPGSMHVWLPLPLELDRLWVTEELRARGVLVRPADLFAVDEAPPPNAIRLSLSGPLARQRVEAGILIVAETLGLAGGDCGWNPARYPLT